MNAIIDSKAFRAGNSTAVRLPKAFGIAPGDAIRIEKNASGIHIRERSDPAEVKRKWLALLDEMKAMPGPGRVQKREPMIFRDD